LQDFHVENTGYAKIKNFLSTYDCLLLSQTLMECDDKITEFRPNNFKQKFDWLYEKCEQLLSYQHHYPSLKLNKVWYVVSTFDNSDTTKLPYIPHFDRERYFKIMIYLNDVGERNGAFSATSTNIAEVERLRLILPDDYKEKGLNSYSPNGNIFTPIVGSEGDAVLFDTNGAHLAGSIEKGKVRKVLRLDFEKATWNQHLRPSLFNRFKNKTWVMK
jgi:hypothetical protein